MVVHRVVKRECKMKFTIHGVRGSVPTPDIGFLKYGGNTSCFEIETSNSQIFCDAGTGFRSAKLLRDKKEVSVFFTHFHHDHIQGFPFNPGLFAKGRQISVSSALCDGKKTRSILESYFSGCFFPINVFASLGHLEVQNFEEMRSSLSGEVEVKFINLEHPGGAVGYSFVSAGKKIVILLDNEFQDFQRDELVKFCKDADLLIWDGMFTEDELQTKAGWGHSSIEQAVEFTEVSDVRKTLICHHAPYRFDSDIDEIRANLALKRIDFGYETMSVSV
jgi:phosphoribosyl 1,2-cyclic phosphodiesterase